jgi:hypothetical protein
MTRLVRIFVPALAAGALLALATAAEAQCVNKAGQGTGSTDDNAKFQAWEAVLQATDWGSWASRAGRLRARLQGEQSQVALQSGRPRQGVRGPGEAVQVAARRAIGSRA